MGDWFKKLTTASKVMVVGSLVLLIAVLIMLPIAILTHHEAGLLTACDTPSGALNYDGACYPIQWDQTQIPLDVYISTTNPYPPADPDSAARGAIDIINTRLGFTALRVSSSDTSDIRIDFETAQEVGAEWQRDAGGGALHHRTNGVLWCEIRTWNNGTMEMADDVLIHELGHCLGLAHDDFSDSAMYPEMHPGGTIPRLTDTDRDTLRNLYHH